jgi:hypothetical protein
MILRLMCIWLVFIHCYNTASLFHLLWCHWRGWAEQYLPLKDLLAEMSTKQNRQNKPPWLQPSMVYFSALPDKYLGCTSKSAMNASICIPHSLNHVWHSQISGFNMTEIENNKKIYSVQLEVIIFLKQRSKIYILTIVKLIIVHYVICCYHFQVFPYGRSKMLGVCSKLSVFTVTASIQQSLLIC